MGCFEIVQCTCNHQENPLGLDRTPRFGWKMRSDTRGDAQTAYRITVSLCLSNALDISFDSS